MKKFAVILSSVASGAVTMYTGCGKKTSSNKATPATRHCRNDGNGHGSHCKDDGHGH